MLVYWLPKLHLINSQTGGFGMLIQLGRGYTDTTGYMHVVYPISFPSTLTTSAVYATGWTSGTAWCAINIVTGSNVSHVDFKAVLQGYAAFVEWGVIGLYPIN